MRLKRGAIRMWRQVAGRPSMRPVNEFLFDCAIHGLGVLNYENDQVSGERRFIERILAEYCQSPEPIFLDVGANLGHYSQLLVDKFPGAKILACEANPKTLAALQERFLDGAVAVVDHAISSKPGTTQFFDRLDHDGLSEHGSVYKGVIEEVHRVESVEYTVPVTTVDELVDEHHLPSIQLLKIDTEGHELEVLRGAEKSLESGIVDLVHVEFGETNLISRVFFRDLALRLSDYIPYRLLPHGVLKLRPSALKREIFAFQNVVFAHKRFQPDRHMRPIRESWSSTPRLRK